MIMSHKVFRFQFDISDVSNPNLLSLLKLNAPPAKAHFCGVYGKGGLSVGSLHLDGSCQRFGDVASDFPPLCMVLVAVERAALRMCHSPGTVLGGFCISHCQFIPPIIMRRRKYCKKFLHSILDLLKLRQEQLQGVLLSPKSMCFRSFDWAVSILSTHFSYESLKHPELELPSYSLSYLSTTMKM